MVLAAVCVLPVTGSALDRDVTLRFLLNDVVVHLSFLRVPGHTSTTVVGPDVADRLEASGKNENSEPLPEAVFEYGRDFSEGTEAVYIIAAIVAGIFGLRLWFAWVSYR